MIDHSTAMPKSVPAGFDLEYGRGLALVEAYSDEWGVESLLPGKSVWFTLSVA